MNDEQLQLLVEEVSNEYFQKPFLHRAYFNGRLRTTGGRYLLQTNHIEINKRFFEHFGKEELLGIIKHELCHYHLHIEGRGYKHGDKDFKELLTKVGAPRFCAALPGAKNKTSKKLYVYTCTKCQLKYKRKRKMNLQRYVCGHCKGKLRDTTIK